MACNKCMKKWYAVIAIGLIGLFIAWKWGPSSNNNPTGGTA